MAPLGFQELVWRDGGDGSAAGTALCLGLLWPLSHPFSLGQGLVTYVDMEMVGVVVVHMELLREGQGY